MSIVVDVNAPPAKAGLIGRKADGSLSQGWEEGSKISLKPVTPHPSLLPSRGEGAKTNMPPKGGGFYIPY